MNRHKHLEWNSIEKKLLENPEKLWSLNEMETTGGEPDVVGLDEVTGEFLFFDCSSESPKRRSLCYDFQAWNARKANKPEGNAIDKAAEMGIEILSPHYRAARDGNMTTIPADYLDKDYKAPSFNVKMDKDNNEPKA